MPGPGTKDDSLRLLAWHVGLFVAGVIVTFFASAIPILILKPKPFGGLPPGDILAQLTPDSVADLTAAWTTYLLNIVVQMLVFRVVKKSPSVVFLIALAVGWSAYYWWVLLRA